MASYSKTSVGPVEVFLVGFSVSPTRECSNIEKEEYFEPLLHQVTCMGGFCTSSVERVLLGHQRSVGYIWRGLHFEEDAF